MNRKRFGQLLIGGIFTLCAAAAAALIELVKREEDKTPSEPARPTSKNEEASLCPTTSKN